MKDLPIVGNYYFNIQCENFHDPDTGRIRVRPLPGQGIPSNLVIECSKDERERYPIGTKFMTESVKVCRKPDGRMYLRAKDQMIYKIDR
ncbi:hypothetical protein ESA94_16410 [Lacibacter luteus]|uniref:Uncharacterized protein n=1 Tax=Lacibacter luteus TaxID=2508719 RepID=A0A4Q1CG24_9BACT|nr:hypothetical protein [Lacibacter luteus]RXK58966.1 hypothetical protein ESA94_16410 [Lacibacter luteus]